MTQALPYTESTAARLREAVFTLVSEGRLGAAEAKQLLVRAEPPATTATAPIAVIGMAGRFGACDDLDAYWAMIAAGEDCIRPIPARRWPDGGREAVGGFLERPELFDPLFFKIAPSEAGLMDPQQRLFLETAWFALEDAALGERDLAGSACGVFVGAGAGDYGRRLEAAGVGDAPLALMGNVASILAARIAYLLDLKGPALAVDTACSSSLVAVHLACEALRRDECDTAIAGGVCVINSGRFIGAMSQAGMISRSGRCHAFDHRADGFVCGEGAGAVVLKRLDRALADGDSIHGVIVGDGMNQDGRTNGITAPSAPAQEALERTVQRRFGIDPAAIGYIETHGTGTPLGDPIEVEALARAFEARPRHLPRIPLGAVKANIGHNLTAAGIAGLLKVLLMLRAGRIPPSAGFQAPNPRLGLAETPFRIATQAEPWTPGPDGRLHATVSSFGFSGTNAHVVVAAAPESAGRPPVRGTFPVLLSARDAEALAQRAGDLAGCLRRDSGLRLDDLAWTLAVGKIHQAQRAAFLAGDREQALAALDRIASGVNPAADGLPPQVQAWLAGGNPDLRAEFADPKPRRVALPPTRLQRVACEPPGGGVAPAVSGSPSSDALARVQRDTEAFRAHPDASLLDEGESFALVEAWGRQAACAALAGAGLFSGSRRVLTRAALGRDFGVIAERRGLFDAVLRIAEREGWLVIEGDLLRLSTPAPFPDAAGLAQGQADLRRQYPAVAPFLDLLQRSTAALPDVLRGRVEGTAVLFPEGRLDLVGAIYQGNRLADYFNELMARAVAALVRQYLDDMPGPVRLLEIGAGTGGATTAILDALRPYAAQVHYTYTDVSLGFLKHGREAFGAAVDPALFDATRSGEAQGFATGEFHILLAANVLHAVPDLGETLGYLWRLLAPAGVLALNEVTAVQDFATLTFGLTEGWWAFRDGPHRLPGAPLADPARWRTLLAGAGFPEMLALGLPEQEPLLQAILLARRDQGTATPCPVGTRVTLPVPRPEAVAASVASPPPLEAAVREEAAQTLGMNAAAIDPVGRFMDYGVDSILGLDLINRLNRRYGLSLSPTVVFEQPTVRDLARHLAQDHGVVVAPVQAPEPQPEAAAASPARPAFEPPKPRPAQDRPTGPVQDEPIAVIGMAGRFADSGHLEEFHAMLAEGRSGIVPARERLGIDPDQPPEHLKTAAPYLRWGGLLRHIDRFDPMFFRMSGREAELTDPQHRIFLTEVWRALEDAGYAGAGLEGADCGIFVGCHGGDYTHLMAEKGVVPDAFAFTGNAASILAARIAYLLDLKGPAVAVDTACSSSLVAVHLACQALRAGECDLALAGGVFINTTVGFNTAAASAGMLSPRGRCAAFDAEADGFVPGEGAGAVLLKPLSRALADGDSIIAIIAGSATNQDGKTNGITAPNAASQAALIQKAQRRAGIQPGEVQYVETHGTGTRLGDPIEIEGLARGFAGSGLAAGACLLGSVKSNVGHAAHAAGIAGLVKLLLSFRHDELYPSLHFQTPNPALNLERTPFAVNTRLRPWPRPQEGRRVAGISSFGFSGTNCHIVLADPPRSAPVRDTAPPGALVALSARSPRALAELRHRLAHWLDRHAPARLVDIAYTLGQGRAHWEYRWAACVADNAGLRAALDQESPSPAPDLPEPWATQWQAAAQVYLDGGWPDFAALHPGGRRIPLPTYPFEERSCWLNPPDTAPVISAPPAPATPELPSLLAPVWDIRPAPLPESLPSRLGLAGDPGRTGPFAAALRGLGVDAVVLADPGATPPDGLAALCLFAPTGADSAATLGPLFAALRARLAQPTPALPLLYIHDGSPLAAAGTAAAPSLRFISGNIHLRGLALPTGLPALDAARHLLAELAATDLEAAIDLDGQRRVRRLRRIELPPVAAPESGGVWLVTGGLGGLGPAVARHLGLGRGARIGLLGRSALDGERAARLAALRAEGVQVHYVAADVADAAALGRAIAEIDGVLGPVSAVIHAAGVPSERGLAESRWEDMARTFSGKLEGALALDRALAQRPLRAFVLFSSLAAELGDFGQCDYAVANAFLGRFAAWRNAEVAAGRRLGRTVALAWPLWEGGHTALGGVGGELMSKALGVRPLARAAGMAVLDLALAADGPSEIVVMTGNEREIARLTGAAPTPGADTVECSTAIPPTPRPGPEPQSDTAAGTADLAPLRAELAALIGRLLKLDPAELRPAAGFGDFGFDSIALKEFADLLAKHYGIEFSPAVFFAHGSIETLAVYLRDTYPGILRPQSAPMEPAPATPPPPPMQSTAPIPEPARPRAADSTAIAIIGMAGRFPGAAELDDFWRLIETGTLAVGPMPAARRRLLGLDDAAQAMGGFIGDIEYFDPAFFRMSRREAVHMDPQHRLALAATWEALENAGIVPASLAGRSVGIFLGQQISGYAALLRDAAPEAMAQAALGNVNALMPNRISYHLDWHGPSESVDTACSSALVAVHRAVRALRGGECELAVAGGTSLLLDLKDLDSTQSLGVLSPDGRCHTFDARANGYVKGEGVGLVVLKPLDRALADGDPIHAVIRGSAVNHGGRAQSLTAPNPKAQRDLIRAALADAAAAPATVGYIEAHGTGTELGDPVEIEALKEVFAEVAADSVALGAVKANIGHLEPASGIAGLFKVVLALGRGVLPPVAGLDTVNPYIDLEGAALYLPRTAVPWPVPVEGGLRRAGVSAFGFGGANAHVVLEEAPASPAASEVDGPALLLLSAPETALLALYARSLAAVLERENAPALCDVAHTLMCGRSAQPARAALSASDRADAIQALRALAEHIETGAAPPATVQLGETGGQGAPVSLGEAPEDQEFFARLAASGNLGRLARFWVAGVDIDWPALAAHLPAGRRVHLPGMPLRRQRCWLDAPVRVRPLEPASHWDQPVPMPPAEPVVHREIPVAQAAPPKPEPSAPVPTLQAVQSAPVPAVDMALVAGRIRAMIAAALYVSADDLDDQARFMDLGLDSILAVEVTRALNDAFGLQIAATRLYDYPTVADLAAYVSDSLGPVGGSVANPGVAAPIQAAPMVSAPLPPPAPKLDPGPILATVRRILAAALYIAPEDLDDQAGFADLGLDSILAVEVADKLNAELGTDLQATRLYDHPTVAALAAYLAGRGRPHTSAAVAVDDAVLAFLRGEVAAAAGLEPGGIDPGTPLDRLSIGPESAARILDAIARRFGCRLDVAEVGTCRDLAAVAALVRNRGGVAVADTTPVPVASTPGPLSPAPVAALHEPPLLASLRAELAALLLVPEDSIETGVPLADLGLDLIAAEELAERFRPLLGRALTARGLLAAPGLAALAADAAPEPVAPPPPITPIAAAPRSEPISRVGVEPAPVEVAVVGIACRYPQAPDKDAFWRLLREGRSGITRVPPERWNPEDHCSGLSRPEQREAVRWGGFVAEVDRFDPLFFNLSPREAELMDPQQRLFLEEAWHAFEDAGLSDRDLKGARCGIFIGAGQGDYSRHLPMDDPAQVTGQLLLGNTASILTARIAYLLDLRGPAIALDTACSSALVATELGFRAIREGQCDLALVGGVNLMTTPQMHVMTAASGMLAPDGQCRTFDDAATGFVPGEGVGLLVLRRLDQALAAGDRVYAVIRAAGTNQDGKTSGITAPSSTSQEALESEVWRRFGIDPADLGYIEAHGTGTRLGDPIEIDALTRAFAAHTRRRQDCPIGSVKTNIGHTLASAGAAGLIKTALALHHGLIPPSLNFATPNRHIDFAQTPFFVPTQALPWRERRLAAVSSFGFSGTNAHIVLAAAPPAAPPTRAALRPLLFALTARDHAGLVRQAGRLAEFLHTEGRGWAPLDVAHTLALRRSHLEQRLAINAQDVLDLAEALTAWLAGRPDPRVFEGKRRRDPVAPPPGLAARAIHATEALADLARLWCEGSDIDWTTLVGAGRLVDLPGTVFAGMRCWVGADPGPAPTLVRAEPPASPTVSHAVGDATLSLDATQPVMANHRVQGRAILPGMASLTWFHAEASRLGYHGPLTGLVWRTPVAAPAELHLVAEITAEGLNLELRDGGQQVAVRALARRVGKPQPLPVDVALLRAECRTPVEPAAIYRRLEAGGVVHGPGFRLLESVQVGAGQVLARLRPANPAAAAPLVTEVSPALLDSALQALGALEQAGSEGPALLPAGLRRCAVYAPLAGPVLAWLTVDPTASGVGRLVADVRLLDEQGEVLAELLGFEARAPQPLPPPGTGLDEPSVPPAPVVPESSGANLLVLRPQWQTAAPPEGAALHDPLILHSGPEAEWALRLAETQGGDALRIDALGPDALAERIAALPSSRPLIFAAWRQPDAPFLTPATLAEAERRGVHKLRGVFQGLAHRAEPGRLLLATRGVQAVGPDDRIDPAFAALTGFARAAARELPGLVLDCVDLAPGQPAAAAERLEHAWLLREPGAGVWAYRQGLRLRQRMARLLPDLAPPSAPVLAQGTVCVLLGGAGGLGRATSLWLAGQCGARIAWIGRRPQDAALAAALAEVARAGGEALYLQADSADPDALRRAVAAVRGRWGHIGLAWHGAIVLRDRSVRELGAADLDAALAPKSHGLLNLIEALADDPPERLCLCSSANAFTVNPGQANYAAACTFVDALALAQIRERGWRVQVLNWGIWGETGIVAEERYLQRARQAGVEPLATAEALEIFGWSLRSAVPQALPMKMTAQALADIEADLAETVRFGGAAAALDVDAARVALRGAFEDSATADLGPQAAAMTALIQHGRERLFRVYARLGLDRQPPARWDTWAAALGIVPSRWGLFRAHLDILARCGWVRLGPDEWVETTGRLPSDPPQGEPPTGAAARLLEAALAGTLDVLTGRRPATEVLFPGGRNDLVEAVYRDDPAAEVFNLALGRTLAALSGGRPLRVVEIGAGTGGATGAVLAALDRYAPGSSYVYTDVSPHFVAAGAARHGQRPQTEFRVLDIGRHPAAQGFVPGSFDVFIAANVLHALPELADTLGHAKALLKPGGAGLLLEATARSDFATFVFGLTDGWWACADPECRIPHSPLLSVDGWRWAAAGRGFRLEGVGQLAGSDGQSVLLMTSDGWIPEPSAASRPALSAAPSVRTPATDSAASTLDTVRRLVCQILRMDPQDMDPDEPLERYGVDSLVVNDIHARLETELGKFSRNLVFEAVTLRALAERLDAGVIARRPAPEEAAPPPAESAVPPRPDTGGGPAGAIAIVGIAGRFPGAGTIETFWDNLEWGHSAIGPLPDSRRALWPSEQVYPGGYLDDVAGFDALFFNISPHEAAAMDPQERLFLETAWASLEHAGRLPSAWEGRVGVFVGVMGRDYLRLCAENQGLGDAPAWSVANRVSHALNLTGPSLATDTACSSALTALHLACESLRRGECEAALAGAVHLILHPASREGLRALGMLSDSGQPRPFSEDADGLVGGEGVCCMVLRRLEDALASGDRILGTIRATGLAANGRTRNYMAPSAESQAEGLRRFVAHPGWAAPDYVECQAMGSPTGDAIEVAGLALALPATARPVRLGSVEGAIGHLEAASGAAQIAKVLGMFQRGHSLPTLGVGGLHPEVAAAVQDRFEIVRAQGTAPRRAMVQSFGAGGGSAFALLEAPPPAPAPVAATGLEAVPLSARTPAVLRQMARNLLDHLRRDPAADLSAIARTLQTGRAAFSHRLALWAADVHGLTAALTDFLAGRAGAWQAGEKRGAGGGNGKGPDSSDPEALAGYWSQGHAVDWDVLWRGRSIPVPAILPSYPFAHRHCWVELRTQAPRWAVAETRPALQFLETADPVPVLPPQRKLVVIEGPGEPEDLRIHAEPLAPPAADEVLIEVHAAGLNFADLLCTRGLHPNLKSYPYLPGFEVAGVVAAVGAGVRGLQPGQRVMALAGGRGGLASHVAVPEHWAVRIPAALDPNLAAATPVGYLTMAHALERAGLRPGETILIQSAAGGTGPFAVQLALARGATVIATAGSAAKLEALRQLGVHHAINYLEEDFAAAVRQFTGGRGVDVVLNTLGGEAIQKGIDLLAAGGRYCEIALAGLRGAGPLDLSRLTENQSLITINLGRVLAEPEASRHALAEMAADLVAGRVRPLIAQVLGMDQVAGALRLMDRRENIGKVILKPDAALTATASGPVAVAAGVDWLGELRAIAAPILGLDGAEIEDDRSLEDYGLNSVSATALMREVYRRFGLAVPVALVYEARSLAELAGRLASGAASAPLSGIGQILGRPGDRPYDPLVPVRAGSGPASFWVHGAPGDASWVARLAEALGGDAPVYGIEARGVGGGEAPPGRVEDMARDYVAAVRRVQPEGPYRLGGYSGGGVIAYEMARQLQAEGQRVEKLVLLDAYAPGNPALRGMEAAYGAGFIYQLAVNWFGRRWGMDRPLTAEALADADPARCLEIALDHLYRHARPEVERPRLAAYLQSMERVGQAIGRALEAYVPAPLDTAIDALLIRCAARMGGADNPYKLPPFLVAADYTEGWAGLLGKEPRPETVGCDHFGLLDDPWLGQAVAAIQGFLAGSGDPARMCPLRERVRAVVEAEVGRVLMIELPEGIPPHTRLAELGAHSVDRAEVAAAAMERLNVAVPLSALAGVGDIDGLIEVLARGVEAG
ncbi:Acyl transferase domain-containing protein [Methylomagnum ishizawai]|uniref:Acyl transferase domain-containing protein n=1 Tax=Methylomagnum ishizawai TaxID=1760988 RepID=A0A1Y6DBM1_9GAMM|nr:SDR family NAD(P)-dependent oxidoreductase [Methylomagnum ishizawai]SMF97504.1 Acyl transferase domain-containing protein [Methylomagnum ishizawai]